MSTTIEITVYGNRDGHTFKFPARFAVCWDCEGHGTTARHIECDGGGFTASEWAEACDDDPGFDGEPGFAEKYLGGYYDRPCETCKGERVVKEIDEEAIPHRGPQRHLRKVLAIYEQQQRADADYRRECEMERRMGA